MTLISSTEMAALRGFAESGMQTTVSAYHQITTAGDSGRTTSYPATPDVTVLGWIIEVTSQGATLGPVAGEVGIVETHRLLVPYGTDIRSGDKVTSGASVFQVQHTSAENTYQPYFEIAMKLFE
jgi:hypothetical protein